MTKRETKISEELVQRLESALGILDERYQSFNSWLVSTGRKEDVQALMIMRVYDFNVRTIRTVQTLLLDKNYDSIFTMILCRPVYEAAVNLLWATRAESGWKRLQTYYAEEDKNWAKKAIGFPVIQRKAQAIFKQAEGVIANNEEEIKKYGKMPKMEEKLKQIEKQDIKQKLSEKEWAMQEYINVYRVLSKPIHAHITFMGLWPKDGGEIETVILIRSCFYVAKVFLCCASSAMIDEVEKLSQKFLDITNPLKGWKKGVF